MNIVNINIRALLYGLWSREARHAWMEAIMHWQGRACTHILNAILNHTAWLFEFA